MNTHHFEDSSAHPFQFHINLSDAWERKYLARRLGISEDALLATADGEEPTVEEIFEHLCPCPKPNKSHAQVHCETVAAGFERVAA